MLHICKVQCHTVSLEDIEKLGIKDEGNKWLPFGIDLESVAAIKMTTDDVDDPSFNCTTLFVKEGGTFIIDTSFDKFSKIWGDYIGICDTNIDNDNNDNLIL